VRKEVPPEENFPNHLASGPGSTANSAALFAVLTVGGVGTARGLRRAGKNLRLRAETLQELTAPALPPTHGFYDEVMKGEVQLARGFIKSSPS
jgi:hypothetical protein